jgi:SHS2 domain-containing protein
MDTFEILDISGDAGIRAFGKDLSELFKNAAIGMYSLITDLDRIQQVHEVEIDVESHSLEGLLVSWLNELIFRFDAYGFMGKQITLKGFSAGEEAPSGGISFSMRASVSGEEFDPERHEGRLLIKAATYHRLKIERKGDRWETEIIFDI